MLGPAFTYMNVSDALCAFDRAFAALYAYRLRTVEFKDTDCASLAIDEARVFLSGQPPARQPTRGHRLWALYCERLGVATGLHAQGWTREQAQAPICARTRLCRITKSNTKSTAISRSPDRPWPITSASARSGSDGPQCAARRRARHAELGRSRGVSCILRKLSCSTVNQCAYNCRCLIVYCASVCRASILSRACSGVTTR